MRGTYYLKIMLIIFCFIGFLDMTSLDSQAEDLFNKEYTIGPEDVLEIQIWDNGDLDRTVEVSQEGSFTFPLIGKVYANGFSVFELENLIKKRLADGYIVNPQINVSVIEYKSRKVFILGAVQNPGCYVLKRKIHLLELISEAGGFCDNAGRMITIVRPKLPRQSRGLISSSEDKENEIITLDLGEFKADSPYDDFFVESGDSIYVNPTSRVFVSGQVVKPGEFEWERGLTVRQAISLAGGTTRLAAAKRTIIVRIKNGKEEMLRAKMDDLVRPDDIIKVPERYF
jgi:polysaccharide export outer membrane protein